MQWLDRLREKLAAARAQEPSSASAPQACSPPRRFERIRLGRSRKAAAPEVIPRGCREQKAQVTRGGSRVASLAPAWRQCATGDSRRPAPYVPATAALCGAVSGTGTRARERGQPGRHLADQPVSITTPTPGMGARSRPRWSPGSGLRCATARRHAAARRGSALRAGEQLVRQRRAAPAHRPRSRLAGQNTSTSPGSRAASANASFTRAEIIAAR